MREQLGKPIPPPVVLGQVTGKFRTNQFRQQSGIRDGVNGRSGHALPGETENLDTTVAHPRPQVGRPRVNIPHSGHHGCQSEPARNVPSPRRADFEVCCAIQCVVPKTSFS